MVESLFIWGTLDGQSCATAVADCYSVAVHWKINLFRVPSGKAGESFVKELSRLFRAYALASALESVALKAAFLFPILVLQRSSQKLKQKEVVSHIDRQLQLWQEGAFWELLSEGMSIQARRKTPSSRPGSENLGREFGNFMMVGRVKQAAIKRKSKGVIS